VAESDPVFAAFCASGLWPGLGRVLAAALPEAGITGPDAVTAQRLAGLPRVGAVRAGRLLSGWIGATHVYEVAKLVVPAGLPARLAGRAVEALGDDAARLLREDPWRLLELPDVRILDADRVAVAAIPGVRREDPRRGRALVGHVLARAARDGHTVQPAAVVASLLHAEGTPDPAAAIDAACAAGAVLAVEAADGTALLGLDRYAMAEDGVAEALVRLAATAKPIEPPIGVRAGTPNEPPNEPPIGVGPGTPNEAPIGVGTGTPNEAPIGVGTGTPGEAPAGGADGGLDGTQQAAVQAALQHGVSVLTGGPGTGKSRTVSALVELATAAGRRVALAAPTGRAAKRLEELCDAPASTLHRLLGAQGTRSSRGEAAPAGGSGFARGEAWPLDADVVVVDEASMLDVELAVALLEACADGTHLLLVGDPAQLPSIGPGRVLADLVESGAAPVTELSTLYRQAEGGAIARLATAVRGGTLPRVEAADREVVVVPAAGSAEAAHRVVQLVTDSIPRALGIPADDVQVVTPVHRGPAGTVELNAALKARLNPHAGGPTVAGFDPGDRVVATANHLDLEPVGFANGEVGVVTEVGGDGTVTVEFPAGPATVSGRALADLRHGWAVTVHRAQGSEWPAVVAVLPPEAGGMLSRPLVYTALTRARRHLSVVHAAGPVLARAVREVGARPRRTRLKELLDAARSAEPDLAGERP
jgi:exodeoxyribonuclease V alpha subunit